VVQTALRIAIISREYPPDTGFGGIATFASHLARGLVELGHEVVVITLAKAEPKTLSEEGIDIHRVKPLLRDNDLGLLGRAVPYTRYVISTASALWQKFTELHREKPFDVVDSPELLAEGFFTSLSKVAPLVIRLYTPHSKFIAEGLHNVSPSFDHQCVAMVERAAMLGADALTSPSRDLAEFVAQDLNYPLEKIRLIYNPIDPTVFCPEGLCAIEPSADRLKVIFVGRLEERKGIKYLVHAIPEVLREVPNARFYIIGDDTNTAAGQKSALFELKEYIRANSCESSVTFIPRVLLSELPAYYRSADVSVVPSVYDNSPYTCLEAMSCGRAVIGTTGGGTREYLVDGESGVLVPPRDPDAIARELKKLLKNRPERKRLGDNARSRVLEKFQRKEIARQTAALYADAIVHFHEKRSPALYSSDYQTFLPAAQQFTRSFNMMLHEELFHWSWRYRIATTLHSLRTRPRFFIAQSVLRLAKAIVPSWATSSHCAPAPITWLENQVLLKQREATTELAVSAPAKK
jgi:glycosyltransferase involved in cell wall biosynthesis